MGWGFASNGANLSGQLHRAVRRLSFVLTLCVSVSLCQKPYQATPKNTMQIGVISPQDWGLAVADATSERVLPEVGVSPAELDRRIRANTYHWLLPQFDEAAGAFHGFYSAREKRLEPPQTVNLIAPWQLLAAYDRYRDEALLALARRAADWFHDHFVITHPMSVVIGGVRESARSDELWTKFAAEFAILCVGLQRRTGEGRYLDWARQSAGFLIQSARHGFAPKYHEPSGGWQKRGWQSFGRVMEAFLELEQATGQPPGTTGGQPPTRTGSAVGAGVTTGGQPPITTGGQATWAERARQWGEFGLSLQASDGGFYLIDDDYFNTDLAPDELRALVMLSERTGDSRFLQAARRFADWLLAHQRADGAWPLTIDRDGNVVVETVGPGDVPNLALALLRLAHVSGVDRYRQAALSALRYSLSVQAIPGSAHPYLNDPRVQWGFWSWDPYYDYTLSADQSTHHVRGMMFLLDLAAAGMA